SRGVARLGGLEGRGIGVEDVGHGGEGGRPVAQASRADTQGDGIALGAASDDLVPADGRAAEAADQPADLLGCGRLLERLPCAAQTGDPVLAEGDERVAHADLPALAGPPVTLSAIPPSPSGVPVTRRRQRRPVRRVTTWGGIPMTPGDGAGRRPGELA